MQPMNLIVIMSDEHNRNMLGAYGHPLVRTPTIDRMAENGVLFESVYTPSPLCVPARAAFATGRYLHDVGFWDNADPYDGSVPSWHHLLREQGHETVSIGKLHFRGPEHDHGFTQEQIPLHVVDGLGDLMGLVRDDLPVRGNAWKMARMAGPGESSYTLYDREIAARAQVFLHEAAQREQQRPWCLFVSFVAPHFPLTAPPEHYYRYFADPDLPFPKSYRQLPDHPFHRDYARSFTYDDHFEDDENVRRAIAGYFGLCSFLDEQIAKVLDAVEAAGLGDKTRIVYTSDHGESLGARGLWGKSNMFEESVAVPLVVTGPDVPRGARVGTPATLLDLFPFIVDAVGARHDTVERPGVSLARLWGERAADRPILSEYHGMGSRTAAYMIRQGRWKLVTYADPDYPDELYDLEADPEELRNRAGDPSCASAKAGLEAALRERLDPAEVDARAKARQAAQLAAHGGAEAVVARGDLGFSPPPGAKADFR
jgi:choline-sulfatase